jgi:Ion channel
MQEGANDQRDEDEPALRLESRRGVPLSDRILFASVFMTVGTLGDIGFFSQIDEPTSVDFLYFSFVTLTTVGYGDRTAASDLGRMLAVTEALFGQLYLVTVVALVIGNVGRDRDRHRHR